MASSNLARVDSGDPQPTPTTAPAPSGPKASSAAVTLATPRVRLLRVVLCAQNLASASTLRAALVRRGFEVRSAAMFHDLGGWLMLVKELTPLWMPPFDVEDLETRGRLPGDERVARDRS